MASVELPEVVAVCINLALNSGRTLSWKIQESCRGTSVQLFWKGGGSDCSLEPQVELAPPRTKKKNSPSEVRRNQRRLAEFMKTKSQEYSSSTRPLLENTPYVILSTLKKRMMEFQESVIHLPLVLVVGHLLAKAPSSVYIPYKSANTRFDD